jgi:3-phosphoshikimate 1-carboxyvinyltransferase
MSAINYFNPNIIKIIPVSTLQGDFQLPGDKSISHRCAIIASLGEGQSRLRNYSSARDCLNTLACLEALGVKITRGTESIDIQGAGIDGLRRASKMLDAGNSGSTIRMLSGVLAGQNFTTEISGDQSIQRRPMNRIVDPLVKMGAKIEAREGGFAPLRITGGNLRAIEFAPPVASAQVKSCILLAGLFAAGRTTVVEKTPTRNHTEVMLGECGAAIEIARSGGSEQISILGRGALHALGDYTVAGDLSSASFFVVAALIAPEAQLRLRHIGINPSRAALIDVLRRTGAQIEIEQPRITQGEPVADLVVCSSTLNGNLELSGAVIANLIDELPVLAVLATQLHGKLDVRGAQELRVKESDRIRSIVDNLRRMKIEIDEFDDGFSIRGPQQLRGAQLESYDDHRIAMSFAIAGLIAEGETEITGADAASVSMPEFYQLLGRMGVEISC